LALRAPPDDDRPVGIYLIQWLSRQKEVARYREKSLLDHGYRD